MKKYFLNFIGFIGLLASLASCSIREEIHFNKDFSGDFRYTVDFSGMVGMMSSLPQNDSIKKDNFEMPTEMMTGLSEGLKDLEGISSLDVQNQEKGKLIISFKFKDIKALNRAYNKLANNNNKAGSLKGNPAFMPGDLPDDTTGVDIPPPPPVEEEKPKEDFVYFSQEGKNLVYRRPKFDMNSSEMKDLGGQMDMLKGMGDFLKMETVLTFDRKIKKSTVKDIDQSDKTDNSITLKLDLGKISQGPKPEVLIKLK
jgi:hypothetical protein